MSATTAPLDVGPGASRTPPPPSAGSWRFVAAAMFCIGWGGNEFTPLLIAYRRSLGYSAVDVDVFLGAYVLGLVPGLLVTSALSDRYGRRPVLLGGLVVSIAGSATLAIGPVGGSAALIGGRLLCGLAMGIAMAVGTAWVKELSLSTADPGAGARRASIALSAGFGLGAGVAGCLAQWGPWPFVLPYLVQIALTGATLGALWLNGAETRFDDGAIPLRARLRVPAARHRRFVRIVLPMAPWVFGSAAVAYAILPQLVDTQVGHWSLLFATGLSVATLGTGVLVQPIAKRLDEMSTVLVGRVAMALVCVGIAGAAAVAATRSPWLAAGDALVLGAAFGIAVVGGLLEVQRIASPDEYAGLSGVFYALAYIGFLLPAALAAGSRLLSYPVMLCGLALVAISCAVSIASVRSRHLPARRRDVEVASPERYGVSSCGRIRSERFTS